MDEEREREAGVHYSDAGLLVFAACYCSGKPLSGEEIATMLGVPLEKLELGFDAAMTMGLVKERKKDGKYKTSMMNLDIIDDIRYIFTQLEWMAADENTPPSIVEFLSSTGIPGVVLAAASNPNLTGKGIENACDHASKALDRSLDAAVICWGLAIFSVLIAMAAITSGSVDDWVFPVVVVLATVSALSGCMSHALHARAVQLHGELVRAMAKRSGSR